MKKITTSQGYTHQNATVKAAIEQFHMCIACKCEITLNDADFVRLNENRHGEITGVFCADCA